MKQKSLIVLAFAFVLTLGIYVGKPALPASATTYTTNNIGYTATTSAAVAVTSSTRVLATTTNTLGNGTSYTRIWATICNPTPNAVVINMNGDKAASQPGGAYQAMIGATSTLPVCFEVTDRNAYSGSIQASSTNQTSTSVTVTEYVQ